MCMKEITIDESKLAVAMEIIEKAASLMEKRSYEGEEVQSELKQLQKDLREITRNKKIQIKDFQRYWSYMDLKTID